MSSTKHLDRLSYWANRGEDWKPMAQALGLSVHQHEDRTYLCCDADDCVVALMRRTLDEWVLFVFVPEARASRWSQFWWRLAHPFADLKPDPRREGAGVARG